MKYPVKSKKYRYTFLAFVIFLVCATTAQGSSSREKSIIDRSLVAMAHGHDISLVNAWHAKAQTISDGAGSNTSFNSSCTSLVYGYRESETSVVQSNVTGGPEFPPHIAAVVLFAETHD